MTKRTKRLNSLLKEVLSEVIRKYVRDPLVSELMTITEVDITKDLHYAKVFVSVMGSELERTNTVNALNQAAGFISVKASKQVVMRHFPELTFKLDTSVDKHMKIDSLLKQIEKEKELRSSDD